MILRSIGLLTGLLLIAASPAFAETAAGDRFDLGDMKSLPGSFSSPYGQVVVTFGPTDVRCPEQHGALEIRSGVLSLHRLEGLRSIKLSELTRGLKAIDDNSWRYDVANSECRLTLTIRLQLKSDDGEWRPATLPYLSRPGVTPEQRAAAMRDALASARERAKTAPLPLPSVSRWSIGSDGSSTVAFLFDEVERDKPQPKCFQAVGTYDINPRHVAFTFLGELGELNRFVVERREMDRYETRLNFIGGDCRLQISVSASRWYHFGWAPLEIE